MWPELLDNLRLEAEAATEPSARVVLRKQMGELLAKRLDDSAAALETYRLVLDEASDDEVIADVMNIGESHEELSLMAADILEPVLRASGKHQRLASVLEMRARAQSEAFDRSQTLRALSVVLEQNLGKPAEAEDALLRALNETPEDPSLFDEIERLAAACDGWRRYADVLEERASTTFDALVARSLWTRLGRVAEERLRDESRAIGALNRAIEQAGDDAEVLASLDRLYSRTGDQRSLADVLERRVEAEHDPRVQADLLHRLAMLQIGEFSDRAQGLATLKIALERDPDHQPAREGLETLTDDRQLFDEVAEVLEQVYRNHDDNERLTRLYEKRISYAPTPEDRVRLRLDLSRLLEERVSDKKRAQRVLEDALGDAPTDPDLVSEIERLAPLTGEWQSAAERLARAISEARDLSPESARDAYIKLSTWYESRLSSPEQAEAALEKALGHDSENLDILRSIERIRRAPGRERDLVATLRRIAELELDPSSKQSLFREAERLAEKTLFDAALAEDVVRQMLREDEADLWALEELSRMRENAGDYKELLALLGRRAELTTDGSALLSLRHRAAEVARDKLDDASRAIDLYEAILDTEPSDERAAAALRAIYAGKGRGSDLERLLGRLVDVAQTPSQRTTLRLELTKLLADRGAHEDAIEQLRAILDEEPGDSQAVLALSQLYEKTGRDEDLADLLTSQIELAKDRGDASAELTLIVRLGEIYESRLADAARAIDTYQTVLARDPSHKGALEALARLYEGKQEHARAAEVLGRLLALAEPAGKLPLALRLAACFEKLGDEAGTRRALEDALASDRGNTEVRKRLSSLYESVRDFGALADLIAGDADLTNDNAAKIRLYRRAAELYLGRCGEPMKAASLLEKAADLAPQDRDLLLALCDAYSTAGRGKEAASALEKIVASFAGKRSKELATIHQRLSRAYLAEGDKGRALSELDQAFKIDPGSVAILRDLGTLSIETGDLDRAQKTFRALLLQKLDASSPISKGEVFFYLGDISHRQGDKAKAIQMLERALENEAGLAKAKELLAELKK
jgi:tetratricopeptide (TPR) repeat protein